MGYALLTLVVDNGVAGRPWRCQAWEMAAELPDDHGWVFDLVNADDGRRGLALARHRQLLEESAAALRWANRVWAKAGTPAPQEPHLAAEMDQARAAFRTAQGIAAVLAMVTWIGGGIHAMLVSNDAVRRIQARTDPDLEAARARIQRRAEGRHLTATQPALAREVGVGRPDLAGADDYGPVDVNHASAAAIARLPGMTDQLARQTVDARIQAGGFSSVEDLGMLLNLRPDTVDQMRDMAIFLPG